MPQQSEFANFVWAHWQILLWTSIKAWWLSELWIFVRDLRRAKGARSDRFSLLIILLAIVISTGVFPSFRSLFPFANLPDGNSGAVRFSAGIVLMWIGFVYRQWSVATLGPLFRTTVFVQDDHRLITHGVYSWIRHPSYAGLLLTVLGNSLTFGNWLSLVAGIGVMLLALAWRMHVEEQAMRNRFGGEYDNYVERSWAIIPFVW
jgi:protein-S-isoprenylcysteine O-methyltransferase Ste14